MNAGIQNIEVFKQSSKSTANNRASSSCNYLSCVSQQTSKYRVMDRTIEIKEFRVASLRIVEAFTSKYLIFRDKIR